MPLNFKYDVFLSRSAKDKPVMRELATPMQNDDLRVSLESEPGFAAIQRSLDASLAQLLCVNWRLFLNRTKANVQ